MEIDGNRWKSMEIDGNRWKSMEIVGNPDGGPIFGAEQRISEPLTVRAHRPD